MPATVAQTVAQVAAELGSREKAPPAGSAVGVCFPSIIRGGVCCSASNIDSSWIGTDVADLLATHLDRPVTVLNDADAAGLAEARYGAGRGRSGTVMVVTLGTGIGGALIHDGRLVPNFEAGALELDGVMAESRASAKAREREGLSWSEYAARLQRYFTHLERVFSPDLFIVGGGISKRPDDYLPLLDLSTQIIPRAAAEQRGHRRRGSGGARRPGRRELTDRGGPGQTEGGSGFPSGTALGHSRADPEMPPSGRPARISLAPYSSG